LPQEIREKVQPEIWDILQSDFKYAGHVQRQAAQIERLKGQENNPLPTDFDYAGVQGLKKEAQQRLNEIKPHTLGQAGRIAGITPADLAVLSVYLRKRQLAEATDGSCST